VTTVRVGDRVRFLGFGEPQRDTALKPGTEGTVEIIDDLGTIHVRWDHGEALGLLTRPGPWHDPATFRPDRFARSD
jgi:Domain of unknown function (DUF4314)